MITIRIRNAASLLDAAAFQGASSIVGAITDPETVIDLVAAQKARDALAAAGADADVSVAPTTDAQGSSNAVKAFLGGLALGIVGGVVGDRLV